MKQAAYALVGLLTGLFVAGALLLVSRLPGGQPVTLEQPPTKVPIEVHVVGGVLRPGVYLFADGSRVQDAIGAAGGLTTDADVNALNLAAKLEDGQQLIVPALGEAPAAAVPTSGFRVLPGMSTATPSADLVNINTASADELAGLPGIGPTIAQRIIDYRQAHGSFAAIEDIMNVAGIGVVTFDNIKALITVQ